MKKSREKMTDKMAKNLVTSVISTVWQALVSLVMFPTIFVQWMTTPPCKMSQDSQTTNGNCGDVDPPKKQEEIDFEIIQKSWTIIGEDKKTNGVRLFMILFNDHEETLGFFKNLRMFTLEDLGNSSKNKEAKKRMRAHATRVMYALESYVDSFDDPECLMELVKNTAETHVKMGIGPEQFAYLTPVICKLIDELATDVVSSEEIEKMKSAWDKLLTAVVNIVKEVRDGKVA